MPEAACIVGSLVCVFKKLNTILVRILDRKVAPAPIPLLQWDLDFDSIALAMIMDCIDAFHFDSKEALPIVTTIGTLAHFEMEFQSILFEANKTELAVVGYPIDGINFMTAQGFGVKLLSRCQVTHKNKREKALKARSGVNGGCFLLSHRAHGRSARQVFQSAEVQRIACLFQVGPPPQLVLQKR